MAKPIKITPVLRGNDAVRFLDAIEKNSQKKVSSETITSIRNGANKLNSFLKNR